MVEAVDVVLAELEAVSPRRRLLWLENRFMQMIQELEDRVMQMKELKDWVMQMKELKDRVMQMMERDMTPRIHPRLLSAEPV